MAFNLNKPHKLLVRGRNKPNATIQNGKVYDPNSGKEYSVATRELIKEQENGKGKSVTVNLEFEENGSVKKSEGEAPPYINKEE